MIVCKRCGFKNEDDDADFCASCGRFLEWTGEKVETPAEPAPAAPAPVPEEDGSGRHGLIESAVNWVREKGATDKQGGDGDSVAEEPVPAAPGDGAGAPAPAGDGAAVLTAAHPAPISAPATPAVTTVAPVPTVSTVAPAATVAPPAPAGPATETVPPAPEPAPVVAAAAEAPPAGPAMGPVLPAEALEPPPAPVPAAAEGAAAPVFGPVLPATDGETTPEPAVAAAHTEPAVAGLAAAVPEAAPPVAPTAAAPAATETAPSKPAVPGPAMPKAAMPGPAMPGPAMPGPAMPGPAVPKAAAPTPSQTLDPSLSAFISRPVSVVEAHDDDKPKTAEQGKVGEGTKPGLAERKPRQRERQPGEVTEEVFRPTAAKPTGPTRVVRDGDIVCPRCGQGNYPWRNYCRRCGLVLDHGKAASERRGPWGVLWSGLSYPVRAHRRRPVSAGERPGRKYRDSPKAKRHRRFSVPRVDKKKMARYIPLLLLVVLVLGYYGPWHTGFRKTLTSWKNDVLGAVNIQYVQLFPVSVQASGQDPGHPVSLATDGDTLTFWSSQPPPTPKQQCTKVTVPPPAGSKAGTKPTTVQKCKTIPLTQAQKNQAKLDGVKSWIELNFAQPESIQAFSMILGAQSTPQEFAQYAKPHEVELQFESGPPIFLFFNNAPSFQDKKFVTVGNTNFVKMTIVSIYPGSGSALQKAEVAITELDAYART